MFDLTPSERKGALVLLALVALGAAADLLRLQPVAAPEPVAPVASAPVARPGPGAGPPVAAVAGPLDLNSATASELDGLPGIGPVLAGRIVSHRDTHGPYRATDDLLAVPGIGPRLYARVAPLVTVRAPRPGGPPLQIARPAGE